MSHPYQPARGITRREALTRIALMLGGTVAGAEFIFNGTRLEGKQPGANFTDGELALMDEIGETILPETDTPGAKAAGIGAFMALIVADCYTAGQEATFRRGLMEIDAASVNEFGTAFVDATPAQRTVLLARMDAAESGERGADTPLGYLGLMKQLTIIGYFTSEIGCTQALRYAESPGMYIPCAPYSPGEPAWFSTVGRGFKVGD